MTAQRKRNTSTAALSAWGLTPLSYGRRLMLLACIFVLMMVLASFSSGIAAHGAPVGTRNFLIACNVLQAIIGFAGTALLCSLFVSTRPFTLLALNKGFDARALLGVILVLGVGMPFLNMATYWNDHISLGGGAIEQTLRSWENIAQDTTEAMLDTRSTWGLIVNVLTIGVLTGLCEELLFRGALQRILASSGHSHHMAIWVAAVIFSVLHFQFFGFLPRVLLGALFGYLLYWTGSIYVSATAHAINNSLYVLLHWLRLRGAHVDAIEHVGIDASGFPAVAILSLVLVLVILIGMRKQIFHG